MNPAPATAEARVEAVYAIDDSHFYLRGWLGTAGDPATSLHLVTPAAVDLTPALHRLAAGPSTQDGFVAYFALAQPGDRSGGWGIEVSRAGGGRLSLPAPPPVTAFADIQRGILGDAVRDRPGDDTLLREVIHPALSQLQRRRGDIGVDVVRQYGTPARAARTTVIVPLYRRIDLLHHQLAQFALDRDVTGADLIYVLDSPELADEFLAVAPALFDLYRVAFRGVVLAENAGYAAANSVAAGLARGQLLLLLNSDVLPLRPGWLSAMARFYESTPRIGALGPRLLYEDHSIQHAGLYFRRYPGSPVWNGFHPFEGLHRSLPQASVIRPVPAVCGACLLVDRDLFDAAGGLRRMYLCGGYEDSDLCLRLAVMGRENWYLPTVELYHLSGQSYDLSTRVPATSYNAWLHTRVWSDRIAAVMGRLDPYTAWGTPMSLIAARRPGTVPDLRLIDPMRTAWYDPFFAGAGADVLGWIDTQDVALTGSGDLHRTVAGRDYWRVCLKGYLQHRRGGRIGPGNIYFDYLRHHFRADPALTPVLRDPEQLSRRIRLRFADLDRIRGTAPATVPQLPPLALVVAPHGDRRVFEAGTGAAVRISVLDGYHRLFFARLSGAAAVRADLIHERDTVSGDRD